MTHPDVPAERRAPLTRRDLLRAGITLPLLASCSVATAGRAGRGSGAGRGTSPTHTSPPTTFGPRGPRGSAQPVTFAFAGDTQFVHDWDTEGGANYTGVPVLADQLMADPLHILAPVAPILSAADLAMVNLESAITNRGTPVAGKNYHFRSPPESFAALRAAGVDVVNMANNHALDYGPVGLEDTFSAIAASGMPVVGLGHNAAEAYRPFRTTIHGQRIAIFGALDWLETALIPGWSATGTQPGVAFSIDRTRLLAAVGEVRPEVDTLVVFLHWGTEGTRCASAEQESLAHSLLGAGADIIVGSHAHRVFGAGRIGTSLVAYGLGNFVYWREDGESGRSGVLLVTATGREIDSYSWVPARITHGIPIPLTGADAAAGIAEWASLRWCSSLAA